jgi:hypothetical protein
VSTRTPTRTRRVDALDFREAENDDLWSARANALDAGSFRRWWIRAGTDQAAARAEAREIRRRRSPAYIAAERAAEERRLQSVRRCAESAERIRAKRAEREATVDACRREELALYLVDTRFVFWDGANGVRILSRDLARWQALDSRVQEEAIRLVQGRAQTAAAEAREAIERRRVEREAIEMAAAEVWREDLAAGRIPRDFLDFANAAEPSRGWLR